MTKDSKTCNAVLNYKNTKNFVKWKCKKNIRIMIKNKQNISILYVFFSFTMTKCFIKAVKCFTILKQVVVLLTKINLLYLLTWEKNFLRSKNFFDYEKFKKILCISVYTHI